MALVFGTAGLPHILMRFFTVPSAQQARRSVLWAMGIIGGFYVLTLFLGFGAALRVGSARIAAVDAGGNLAGPLLAQFIGGGPDSFFGNFMLAFVSAVAFATIVAVVAGLVLAAASAMAHDLYVGVVRAGKDTTPQGQVKAARIATAVVGAMSIGIGIAAKGQNVAVLVGLAFAVAASANFPCVLLTLYWKRCNTGGIIAGMLVGTIAAVDAGGNLAGPLLAQFLGGGPDSFFGNFMLAFVSAVAFATIVAVVAGLVLAAASAMAHDLYVGVVRAGKDTTPQGQIRAARIATAIVGAMSIGIGIAAKGQNVAVLVGLAFAVAASANFPCVLLTLYWKRCNTGGIVAGMLVGTVAAVGLTLVSPNLTYPIALRAAAHKVLEAAPAKRAAAIAASAAGDATAAARSQAELVALDKAEAKAHADLDKWAGQNTSFMGLEKPLFELKNPGLVSIPLGFLAVIIGSLLYRDKRAESMWNEVYARQNTGLMVSKSAGHVDVISRGSSPLSKELQG